MTAPRTAVLAGATGLVGGHLLRRLLEDEMYGRVVSLGRRTVSREGARLEQRVVDFEHLASLDVDLKGGDAFCALGTTIKRAGSEAAFRKVDHDAVVAFASWAKACGARQLLVVSSLGASAKSASFYTRVKGETEEALRGLGYASLAIFRPSFLTGERAESRPGERIALAAFGALSFALVGPLRKIKPIAADDVAAAMVRVAADARPGAEVYESDRIAEITEIASASR